MVRPYRGLRTVSHGGLWPGYKTEFLRVPSEAITVVAISNNGATDPNLLAHRALVCRIRSPSPFGGELLIRHTENKGASGPKIEFVSMTNF